MRQTMIFMFGFLDRALDMIGLASIVYWTFQISRWWYRKKHPAT
jgi:hypothetical protein